MAVMPSRHKSLVLLAGVIVLQVLLLAVQNKRDSQVRLIRSWTVGAVGTASLTIQLDRGEHDGIRRNMGVITPDGVVGKIIEAYPNTSLVLLLTARESGVGAKVADSGIQSPVGGVGEPLITMKYVPSDDEVSVGQRVVTSGMDRIFPRDLPVGTITEIKAGNQFKQI